MITIQEKIQSHLLNLKSQGSESITKTKSTQDLEQVRIDYFGKKGKLTKILKSLKDIPEESRAFVGKQANEVKKTLQEILNTHKNVLIKQKTQPKKLDISLPGRKPKQGHIHPISQIIRQVHRIFKNLGFQIVQGPELEEEYYNFTALNLPENHPARAEQDSFYLYEKHKLLRTQTSPMQIRIMEKESPPLAMISSGRCFRRDNLDFTHSHTFHQVEGLVVDKNISFADLKGILSLLSKALFGAKTKIRFRPDYFPFTEPSAEYSVSCFSCAGTGCNVCKSSGWIELGGCGLVNPIVFSFVNIDSTIYSGYAFGLGIERLAMIQYQIPDIRQFYDNDFAFLKQF